MHWAEENKEIAGTVCAFLCGVEDGDCLVMLPQSTLQPCELDGQRELSRVRGTQDCCVVRTGE